jgi:hypothetical protein
LFSLAKIKTMKTRYSILTLAFALIITINSKAQDSPPERIKEFQLAFSGFSPLNTQIKYKQQINQKIFFKIGLVNLSMNSYGANSLFGSNYTQISLNGGLELGLEFRKNLSDKLTLFHGPNISYIYSYRGFNRDIYPSPNNESTHMERLSYTLGLMYSINSNIFIGAEINPGFYLQQNKNHNLNSRTIYSGFSLDNRIGQISIILRR